MRALCGMNLRVAVIFLSKFDEIFGSFNYSDSWIYIQGGLTDTSAKRESPMTLDPLVVLVPISVFVLAKTLVRSPRTFLFLSHMKMYWD